MPILHLGVVDVPYVRAPSNRRKRGKVRAGTVTTGDVATWLENRYQVMETFVQLHEADMARDLEDSLSGSLESFLMGAPVSLDPLGGATSKIEDRFKQFLSQAEIEKLGRPGVPTQAALAGKSSRFKGKRGKRRPSFIDTGLYQSSMKVWVD